MTTHMYFQLVVKRWRNEKIRINHDERRSLSSPSCLKARYNTQHVGVSTKDPEDEEAFLAHIELSKDLARKVTRSEVK